MSNTFICRYCGKEKLWVDRDYDVGLRLAEINSFEALGHCEYVSPYLICKECASEIMESSEND